MAKSRNRTKSKGPSASVRASRESASPVSEAPVPEAPVSEAAVSEAPVPEAPVPEAPASQAPDDPKEQRPTPSSERSAPPNGRKLTVRVLRQDGPGLRETRRWENFEVALRSAMTVADVLREIEDHPVNQRGNWVAPVAWDSWCLDETCGACTLLVNGRVQMACGTSVSDVVRGRSALVLEPLSKFPVVRDLVVDRSSYGESLRRMGIWSVGEPNSGSTSDVNDRLDLGRCTHCGACLEACPEYGDQSDYVGAAVVNQARLAQLSSGSPARRTALTEAMMTPGGISDCGKAQVCAEVCPANVPLVDSLQRVARSTTKRMLFNWLLG